MRALAVSAVILYHFFPASFPGGFLGVDVFFVLSGFLITSLLLRERATTGAISLPAFWKRRARRILPAAFTLAAFFGAVTLLADPDLRVGIGGQLLGILTFSTNWVEILGSGSYFDQTTPTIFVHYWSLAVEEQFYLFWPLVVTGVVAAATWVAARRGAARLGAGRSGPARRGDVGSGRRRGRLSPDEPVPGGIAPGVPGSRVRLLVGLVAATAALASAGLMAWRFVPGEDPSRLYYGTDTHAFGLLIGAATAALVVTSSPSRLSSLWPAWRMSASRRRLEDSAAGVLLVGLLAAVMLLGDDSATAYRGGIAAACLATAVVVVTAARGTGPVARALGHPALAWIGLRSYSLYLVHWPVFVLVDTDLVDPVARSSGLVPMVALALTVALAAASYRWIEVPFLHRTATKTAASGTTAKAAASGTASALAPPRRRPALTPRLAMAGFAVATLAAGSTAAALTAPERTSVQVQLDELARQQEEAERHPAPEPPPPSRTMPPGSEISVIGDSVALGATESFLVEFPGMTYSGIDAEVSRSWISVPSIVASRQSSGLVGEVVILGIGANGPAGAEYVLDAIDALGPDVLVVVINAHSPLPINPSINEGIREAVAQRPHAELADWDTAVSAHPDYLAADDVHPADMRGRDLYADVAREALERLLARTPAEPGAGTTTAATTGASTTPSPPA